MADESGNAPEMVAKSGFFTGLHSGMGLAAKGMVVAFVVFTALKWISRTASVPPSAVGLRPRSAGTISAPFASCLRSAST